MTEAPIVVEHVDHGYGEGELRRQVLFDINAVIRAGEIVILSGPSGSGKTTLLTLMGALRSTQSGSLRVLGRELCGADEATLTGVRRQIGYVFQSHNLLEALSVAQNVELGMQLHDELSPRERSARAEELLASVGLPDLAGRHPGQLSGGQRQRVAIARALAARPRILLADEPTASLDRKTGREIVSLIQELARERGVTVVLVTHDSRILDVADRILSLEDGRLSSFMRAVTADTQHLWSLLARDIRHGELVRRVREIQPEQFLELLEQVTEETRELVEMVDLAHGATFDSMLAQVLDAFALKIGELLGAEAARVYLADPEREELFTLESGGEGPTEARLPGGQGLAGRAAASGHRLLQDDPAEPAGPSRTTLSTPEQGHSLAVPVIDSQGAVFAVLELVRPRDGAPFTGADAAQVEEQTRDLASVLEAWFRMSCSCRAQRGLASVRARPGGCVEHAHPGESPCPHCDG